VLCCAVQASFLFLELIHPVTHAVTNALKRVVIIVASVVVFRTPLSAQVVAGSAVAISGTVLYSLMQYRHHHPEGTAVNKQRLAAS
jgi:solute carrier family 35, member E1